MTYLESGSGPGLKREAREATESGERHPEETEEREVEPLWEWSKGNGGCEFKAPIVCTFSKEGPQRNLQAS